MIKLGNYEITLKDKEGWKLLAPQSYWDASEEELDKYTGGCGPGKLGDYLVPDTMLGESVFLACQIHDWMYYVGTTLEDKKWSDLLFLLNMTILIDDGESLDVIRLRTVMAYYEAVSFGGKGAFED